MENTQNLPDYIVYTDGGCAINPGGHGAYAAIIIHTDTGEIEEYTNGYKNTTNNRMEIMAVIEAFEHIKKGTSVELHADSKYVLKTIDGQFSRKKNLDLWERLDKACEGLELSLCWVPGHRGHYYNERCDQMCTETMNNTNDLIVDSGYTGKKISTPRTVTGAMSVKIQVPKEFLHSKIEKLDVKKYQKKYQINRICAERLLEFRKEKKPKFKDYMMLQTGGKDVFYVRFLQRKENCSKQIVVLVINYKRKTYRSFDNPTPTYFFFPLYQFKTRKREYKIQSKLGRRIKPEKGEYIEIFVNPKNPTELYEPADNFSSEDYVNSEWVTIKNLAIGGTLLMLTGWTLICFIL